MHLLMTLITDKSSLLKLVAAKDFIDVIVVDHAGALLQFELQFFGYLTDSPQAQRSCSTPTSLSFAEPESILITYVVASST